MFTLAQVCLLRPIRRQDWPAHAAAVAASIRELSRDTRWAGPTYGPIQSQSWTAGCETNWAQGREFSFVACDRVTGGFLGVCALNRIDWTHAVGNLTYWTDTRVTTRGVASFAAVSVARFGFRQLGLQRIEILTASDNAPSLRVAEKVGARREGLLRARLLLDGRRQDAVLFGLLPIDLPLQL